MSIITQQAYVSIQMENGLRTIFFIYVFRAQRTKRKENQTIVQLTCSGSVKRTVASESKHCGKSHQLRRGP
jgi:hypothetical protein